MIKKIYTLLFALLIMPLASCDNSKKPLFDQDMYYVKEEINPIYYSDVSNFSSSKIEIDKALKDMYLADNANFTKEEAFYAQTYVNGIMQEEINANYSTNDDAYMIFYGNDKARVISRANGYALTLPTSSVIYPDLSTAQYQSKFITKDYTLAISSENSNPFASWKTYHDEWLTRYLKANDSVMTKNMLKTFFTENNLSYTRDPLIRNDLLSGYEVELISILINDNENIDKPYYNIAIVRKPNDSKKFNLFIMKSKEDMSSQFDSMISSLSLFIAYGKKNGRKDFELKVPSYLNYETQKYYKKMIEQNYTEWGIFNHSMFVNNQSTERIIMKNNNFKKWLDYDFEIMPTYTHIGEVFDKQAFPIKAANTLAGGNGFNNKPVIQFTLQFTSSNNVALHAYSPMFDILRGKYDDYFKMLAKGMKEYGKPILFRVNNEMNSDWVSYCGMVTLLDTDIFKMTWERMANILKEEGVDNVLYIFNPTNVSYPYSSWGEDLCYLPSLEYVSFLGLTAYEYNNYETNRSFYDLYSALNEKNEPYWKNFPAIISEFGCGSGGNYIPKLNSTLYRNAKSQAFWVENMFIDLNENRNTIPFLNQIKGAIWFNANDENGSYITNLLVIDDVNTPETILAFKEGLAQNKKLKNK